LSTKWKNIQVDDFFKNICELPFYISNDADLAGMAEVTLGAGKGKKGVVLVITIGTGIGSGLFYNGKLIPNLEIGKLLHKDGEIIEFFCADSIRKKEELTLEEWALRFDILLQYIKTIFSPNLIILGGGISKKYDKFKQYLNTDVKIKVAKFKNNAGIIGAAMYASKKINK
jgi:polyphosphate glucokinase